MERFLNLLSLFNNWLEIVQKLFTLKLEPDLDPEHEKLSKHEAWPLFALYQDLNLKVQYFCTLPHAYYTFT